MLISNSLYQNDELAAANQQQTNKVTKLADLVEMFGEQWDTEVAVG
jgi:hypothetical protein